ncbi:4'-phosphopantetheinyl transferase superfamily protein [Streptomyces sp. AM 4-1-1]|uniref:4'-phosphopantetheinyl transferase family protein n=1 Tax=Streptomyces sp. AM 4-1-1 TaxID=3028710 RepID=UPI0023B975B1|nr:4'-phosphopantetheinyl transferase superfamily protein [Streptomyces sp. AM 4-1-1]WEH32433.1 4'-phosphopantetheinyl transferase superfamily protein [Streptomyces sp. AM 4-1-1]
MNEDTGVVEIWRFPLDLPAPEVERLARVLDDAEHDRRAMLRAVEHRRRFTVSHARTRLVLGERLGVPPTLVRLRSGRYGKPELEGGAGTRRWHFSLSHSGDLAVLALCHGREVGVDVEHIRPDRDVVSFAARWFGPDESDWVAEGGGPDRVRRCLRLWTRKEACVKAAGGRLVQGLRLAVGQGPRPCVVDGPHGLPGTWTVADLPVGAGHVGAVAVRGVRPFRVLDRSGAVAAPTAPA